MRINMKTLFFFLLLSATFALHAQQTLPPWFLKSVKQLKLNNKYELKGSLKPTFFVADFDGDGKPDVAMLANERRTKKKGVLIIQQEGQKYFVFGAGKKFGNGLDNYKWAGGWKIYTDKIAYETLFDKDGAMSGSKKIVLKRPAIFIYDLEDGEPNSGGIIYWTDKKYIWIHQGE